MDIWIVSTFFTIMINAAMNISVQAFLWTYVFNCLILCPRVEFLGHMVTVFNL